MIQRVCKTICNDLGIIQSRNFAAISGENWVNTLEGPRQVKDLTKTPCAILVNGQQIHIDNFKPAGEKDMICVDSYRGQSFTCTFDTQIITYNQNKLLDKEPKMIKDLEYRNQDPTKKKKNNHPVIYSRGTQFYIGKNVVQNPQNIDQDSFDWGWIAGWVVGDGYYPQGKAGYIGFYVKDVGFDEAQELAWRAYNIIHRLIPTDYRQPITPTGPKYCTREGGCFKIWSIKINRLMEQIVTSHSKNILTNLEEQPYSFLMGFIQGLFAAEGSVVKTWLQIHLTNTNYHNLLVTQRVLQRYGIMSSIRKQRDAGTKIIKGKISNVKAAFYLKICAWSVLHYHRLFGFGCRKKNLRLGTNIDNWLQKTEFKSHFTTEFKETNPIKRQMSYELLGRNRLIEINGVLVQLKK